MNVYQDKQGKLRAERRVSTIADRRVNKTAVGGSRVGVADRRAKTTDDLTEGCPITPTVVEHTPGKIAQEKFDRAKSYNSGNSALLIEYREALIKAYELGNAIKDVYGIVPPKVLHGNWTLPDGDKGNPYTISLQVS
jgi:hypothetical protein